jgi:cellulose binding protein with CBM2 domain
MPGKHHGESFASRHRYPIIVGVVLACLAVTGVLAAVHNRREPATALLVTPASAVPSPTAPVSPSPVAATASPSASASPSPSRAPAARRSPSKSPRPSPSVTRGQFTARYVVMNSRRSSFQAAITVTNEGRAARSWQVVVTHDPDAGVRVEGSLGVRVSTSGNTITFSGGPLDGGDSVTFGYQASKDTRDDVQPTSCRVDGVECRVTVRRSRR